MAFTITAESKPIYDGFGWGDHWTGNDWVYWHKAMVSKFGKAKANQIWIDAWLDGVSTFGGGRGVAAGSGSILDSVPLGDITMNTYFRNYLKEHKELYDAVNIGIGGFIRKPLGGAIDVVGSAVDTAESGAKGISNTAKVLEYVIPIVIIAGGALILYRGYKGLPIIKLA